MRLTKTRLDELRKIKRFSRWLDQYALVELFRNKHNRFPHAKEEFPTGNKLGRWYGDSIKSSYQKGHLQRWQVFLLNKFDYVFEPPNRWESNYNALKNGWEKHPESWPYVYFYTPNLKRIEKWCKDQRFYYDSGKLSPEKITKLNSINFIWGHPDDVVWFNHYDNLVKWTKKHHRLPERSSSDMEECFYKRWLAKERSKINKGNLSPDRTTKIELLCRKMEYDPMRLGWDKTYSLYLNWYSKHGKKPKKYATNKIEGKLGRWIVSQNILFNKGLLLKSRKSKFLLLKKQVSYQDKKRN
jgi:hypothetical protein